MPKGSRPGERRGGRKKGTPNRFPAQRLADLRTAILEALDKAGGKEGAVGYLSNLAVTNSSAFASLLGRVIPLQVGGDPEGVPIANTFTWLPPQ